MQFSRFAERRLVEVEHWFSTGRPSAFGDPRHSLRLGLVQMLGCGLLAYTGHYRTRASGDVDIAFDSDRLLLRSGGLKATLAASDPIPFSRWRKYLRIHFSGDPEISQLEIEENGKVVARGLRVPSG